MLLGVTACADGAAEGAGPDDALTVVTTTTVCADMVREVAGDAVVVDPIIDSTVQDPRSCAATAEDRAAVADADLVVLNGGGYNAFMEDLAAEGDAPVVEAYGVSGLAGETAETLPGGTSYLEWMDGNVTAVAEALGALRPTDPGTAAG